MKTSAATFAGTLCRHGHTERYVISGQCAVCSRAATESWRSRNSTKARNASRKYIAERRDVMKEKGRISRIKNPSYRRDHYVKNRERCLALDAAYAIAHPERKAVARAKRRARLASAPGDGVTVAQWEAVLNDSLGLCAYCNERKPLTLDHIEPLARGGAHDVTNIAAACKPCNCSKNETPLLVWLARLRVRSATAA